MGNRMLRLIPLTAASLLLLTTCGQAPATTDDDAVVSSSTSITLFGEEEKLAQFAKQHENFSPALSFSEIYEDAENGTSIKIALPDSADRQTVLTLTKSALDIGLWYEASTTTTTRSTTED